MQAHARPDHRRARRGHQHRAHRSTSSSSTSTTHARPTSSWCRWSPTRTPAASRCSTTSPASPHAGRVGRRARRRPRSAQRRARSLGILVRCGCWTGDVAPRNGRRRKHRAGPGRAGADGEPGRPPDAPAYRTAGSHAPRPAGRRASRAAAARASERAGERDEREMTTTAERTGPDQGSDVARPETLELVDALCVALADATVTYCHWKSNEALDRSLSGDNDLDLLVARPTRPASWRCWPTWASRRPGCPARPRGPGGEPLLRARPALRTSRPRARALPARPRATTRPRTSGCRSRRRTSPRAPRTACCPCRPPSTSSPCWCCAWCSSTRPGTPSSSGAGRSPPARRGSWSGCGAVPTGSAPTPSSRPTFLSSSRCGRRVVARSRAAAPASSGCGQRTGWSGRWSRVPAGLGQRTLPCA